MRGLAVALVAVTLAAAGCGGGEDSHTRPQLVERLATLCEETRVAVEELGEPRDEGAAVFRPWAAIGRDFVADVRRLQGTTPRERRQVRALADYYEGFYDSLRLGYRQWSRGESTTIKMTLERAYALLASAEKLAGRMGASECAVRPFDEA
ncbi:MAG TPA: hypothetical protein VH572_08985 [Gaiella sp.]